MKRELIILIAAVLAGIAAVVFYQIRIASVEAEIKSQISETTKICTVLESVGARQMLQKELLKKAEVPHAFLHPKTVKWSERKRLYGQRVVNPLQPGQPVLWSDMEERSRRSVDGSILPGRAVVTIPIDMVGGVSGLISPGSRIDLFGIFKRLPTEKPLGGSAAQPAAETPQQVGSLAELNDLLSRSMGQAVGQAGGGKGSFYVVPVASNLGVFAVGSRTQSSLTTAQAAEEQEGYSTISFDVSAKMQVLLIMAMQKVRVEGGRLICVLRSNQAGAETQIEPGKAYSSQEFLKMIAKANAEMAESK